ncbi:MAG TPA: hypothetical protein VJ952_09590 [Opitutales bacterium]|nr:hypothetical protein [Opitutales bacterium]
MDNFLEILIPLIFAAIYFFGNMFSGKSKEEEESPPGLPRSRDSEDEEAEAVERQRRIQEEIRRKIMERRRASEGGQSAPAVPIGQELRERRQEVEAPRAAREEAREEASAYSTPPHEAESKPASPTFTWDESDNAYDDTLQARLRRIEKTKREAEKLRKQAAKRSRISDDGGEKRRQQNTGGYFTGTVRGSLRDPQAARVAFVYGEVLGRPISLRKGASSVPGLDWP